MREIVTISVGQCGNQIGWRFWDVLAREQGSSDRIGDEALSSFFREADGGFSMPGRPRTVRARAVLVDMEEGVVSQIQRSALRGLFDSTSAVTDVSGAGNNWAFGYAVCGPAHIGRIMDRVRLALEACESPQAFFLMHSLGGGTGSGVGSYVLEQLADHFPEPYRLTTSLFPSENDDVITSPYNALLATSRLIESADAVFSIENQALLDVISSLNKCASDGAVTSPSKTAAAGATSNVPPRRDGASTAPQAASVPAAPSPTSAFQSVLDAADIALAASSSLVGKSSAASTKTTAASLKRGSTAPMRSGGAARTGGAAQTKAAASSKSRLPLQRETIAKGTVAQRLLGSPEGIGRAAVVRTDVPDRSSPPPRPEGLSGGETTNDLGERLSAAAAAAAVVVDEEPVQTAVSPAQRSGTAWDSMNELVARMLSDVTAGMRFPGALNFDLNEIASTLVPFPRLHFLSTSLSPIGRRALPIGYGLDTLVSEALSRSNMLIRGNLRRHTNLACGLVLRGRAVAVSDVVQSVRKLGMELPLPPWNPDGFKVAICSQQSVFAPVSATIVANSTGVATPLANMYSRFLALYRVRAHLHHYVDTIDAEEFQSSAVACWDVIQSYKEHGGGHADGAA